VLPPAAVTVQANGQSYECLSGVFYQASYTGQISYQVVQAPIGATVHSLPAGAQQQVIGGAAYFNYGTTGSAHFTAGTRRSTWSCKTRWCERAPSFPWAWDKSPERRGIHAALDFWWSRREDP
jgi:hypothetical protein